MDKRKPDSRGEVFNRGHLLFGGEKKNIMFATGSVYVTCRGIIYKI